MSTVKSKKVWIEMEIDFVYDMIRGYVNRICVTKDMEERLHCAEFAASDLQKLAELTQCRSNNYSNADEIYEKYRHVSIPTVEL